MRSRWKKPLAVCCSIILLMAWASTADPPRLVILISMDQMRADYFDRFANEYTGGLKRISRDGLVCSNADLNYACSETGPGHASLATGSYPHTHGILANEWPDRRTRQQVNCVRDTSAKPLAGEGGKVSPSNLTVTALGDWLKRCTSRESWRRVRELS